MNKIVSFLMVGLFIAVFNVATVAADVPAPTGDDTHNTTGEDCTAGTAAEIAACEDRKSSHADSNHGGMAKGTDAIVWWSTLQDGRRWWSGSNYR